MPFSHQLIASLVAFIWGTNFVLIKIGLADLPPFLFVALRFTLAALPLVFFLPRPKVSWAALSSYGVLIGFGQFGVLFWAMQAHISPGLAALVVQTQVFFTILMASYLYKEQLKPSQFIALGICAIGLVLIVLKTGSVAGADTGQTNITTAMQTSGFGVLLVLLAALSWSAGNIVVKHVGKVDIIAFLAWSSLFAVPPLLLMSFMLEGPALMLSSLHAASWQAWAIVLWQTIGNTLIGYGLWNLLLSKHSAAKVTPWALLVPVFGLAASGLWLGESLPWWKLLAAVLIMSGLVINIWATQPTRAK